MLFTYIIYFNIIPNSSKTPEKKFPKKNLINIYNLIVIIILIVYIIENKKPFLSTNKCLEAFFLKNQAHGFFFTFC